MKAQIDTGTKPPKSGRGRRALIIAVWIAGGLLGLLILAVCCVTWYLTDARATRLFNHYASEYFNADFRARNVKFTIWSTFPHFCLEIDSLEVNSRTLAGVPAEKLPKDASRLLTLAKLKGNFNVVRAVHNHWDFGEVSVNGLNVNLLEVNDSVNNYDILPQTPDTHFQIPFFTFKSIDLKDTSLLTYASLSTGVSGHATLKRAVVERLPKEGDRHYTIHLSGLLTSSVHNHTIIKGLPVNANSSMELCFDPFNVKLSTLQLDVASLKSRINCSIDIGHNFAIRAFNANISSSDMIALWRYVSKDYFPALEDLVQHITLESSVSLRHPYSSDSEGVPQFDLYVKRLGLSGPGTGFVADASVNDLLDDPEIALHLRGHIALGLVKRFLPQARNSEFAGNADVDLYAKVRASAFKDLSLNDLRVRGDLDVSDLNVKNFEGYSIQAPTARIGVSDDMGANRLTLNAPKAAVTLGALNLDVTGLQGYLALGGEDLFGELSTRSAHLVGSKFKFTVDAGPSKMTLRNDSGMRNLTFSVPEVTAKGAGMTARLTGVSGIGSYRNGTGDPANGDVRMKRVHLESGSSALAVDGVNMRLRGKVPDMFLNSNMLLDADTLRYHDGTTSLALGGVKSQLKASPIPASRQVRVVRDTSSRAYLHPALPEKVRSLLQRWDASLKLKVDQALVLNKIYPAYNRLSDIDLTVTTDSVRIGNLRLQSQRSGFAMHGTLSGLRRFLLGDIRENLRTRLYLDIDTLSFNQIAHTYKVGAHLLGKSDAAPSHPGPITREDTTTLYIPRNLDAEIYARAKACEYTNLNMYDLSTRVTSHGGRLDLDSLLVHASFGHAIISANYDTSNLYDMRLGVDMQLLDVDVVKFFEKYQTLLAMMPQMKNLSGYVSAGVAGDALIFPNMYLNIPSLQARVFARGRELLVRQNHFIRHITRLMLIPTSKPLHIANINANANVHDCLLELYPFHVSFNSYDIRMMGVNDFMGDLNYHIDILKAPIPLPFGIHIGGKYHKPKIRLSGRHYKARDMQTQLGIYENDSINTIREVKYYLKKFMSHAADADNTAGTLYAFPTE